MILASGRRPPSRSGWSGALEGAIVTAAVQVPLGEEAPLPGIPGLALRRERAPNLAGAELLGYTARLGAALAAARTRRS